MIHLARPQSLKAVIFAGFEKWGLTDVQTYRQICENIDH